MPQRLKELTFRACVAVNIDQI